MVKFNLHGLASVSMMFVSTRCNKWYNPGTLPNTHPKYNNKSHTHILQVSTRVIWGSLEKESDGGAVTAATAPLPPLGCHFDRIFGHQLINNDFTNQNINFDFDFDVEVFRMWKIMPKCFGGHCQRFTHTHTHTAVCLPVLFSESST